MNPILAALTIATIPHMPIAEDRFDSVEVNHLYDTTSAGQQLDQYIFWDGGECQGWRRVPRSRAAYDDMAAAKWRKAWCKANPHRTPPPFVPAFTGPLPIRSGDGWVLIFHDGGRLRRIRCLRWFRTYTYRDPEVANRAIWGSGDQYRLHRRGLAK